LYVTYIIGREKRKKKKENLYFLFTSLLKPLVATYGIATFGPKLALQNKVKVMKAKMKGLVLAQNDQAIL
jgi:hypothetical protein